MKGDFIRFLADSLIVNRNPSHCSDQCDLGAFCLMFKLQERVSIKPYYLFYSDYILHLFWQSKDPRLQNQSSVQKNPLQVPSDYCVRLLYYIELTTFFSDWPKVHSEFSNSVPVTSSRFQGYSRARVIMSCMTAVHDF